MDKPKTTTGAQGEQAAPEPKVKKRYEPPAILYHAPLEATAGACGISPPAKADSGSGCVMINS